MNKILEYRIKHNLKQCDLAHKLNLAGIKCNESYEIKIRFAQKHQMMMVGYLRDTNQAFVDRVNAYMGSFQPLTIDPSVARHMAEGVLYQQLQLQSTLWAYMDTFRIFGIACFTIIPLLLLMKSIKALAQEGVIKLDN